MSLQLSLQSPKQLILGFFLIAMLTTGAQCALMVVQWSYFSKFVAEQSQVRGTGDAPAQSLDLEEIKTRALADKVRQLEATLDLVRKQTIQLDESSREGVVRTLRSAGIENHFGGALTKAVLKKPHAEAPEKVEIDSTRTADEFKSVAKAVTLRKDFLAAIPSIVPSKGWLSSGFGMRSSPFHGSNIMHKGVDIAADEGTPVYASGDGVVRFSGEYGSFGNYVSVVHGNGIVTKYGHNSVLLVKKGEKVKRGQMIARVGSSGQSTGAHLHYEVWVNNKPVDPQKFFFRAAFQSTPVSLISHLSFKTSLDDLKPVSMQPQPATLWNNESGSSWNMQGCQGGEQLLPFASRVHSLKDFADPLVQETSFDGARHCCAIPMEFATLSRSAMHN
jgi:murein DD-endopeptidase MepM/ murein hydrolase activator NlpD